MRQVLYGSARTTEAVRRAIQPARASIRALAERFGINPKSVVEWKKRSSASEARMGPKQPRPTLLSKEEEAVCVAFRKQALASSAGMCDSSFTGPNLLPLSPTHVRSIQWHRELRPALLSFLFCFPSVSACDQPPLRGGS